MDAASRDQVFAELRKKGIKAIKVVAADGSKANGEMRGVRKRIVTLIAVLAALVAGLAVFFAPTARHHVPGAKHQARPLPRQEIRGSRARVENAAQSLGSRAERFLALFAEPGRPVSVTEADWPSKAEFESVLRTPIEYAEDEYTEQIDLKRMVETLKLELGSYLRAGGYASGYIKELVKRQELEKSERDKAVKHLDELLVKATSEADKQKIAEAYDYWMKSNVRLQSMGIYPMPLPSRLVGYDPEMSR